MAELVESLDPTRVRANLVRVRERIAAAAGRAGRKPSDVELLAATKYVPDESMGALVEAGIGLVGENTAQSLAAKHARWGQRFKFDFIGHLQSRKAKDVVGRVRLIHSVESESLLARLERSTSEPIRVLLEVNVSHERSKFGVPCADVDAFLDRTAGYENVSFAGLMTMPPFTLDPESGRTHFAALRELGAQLREAWAPRHSFESLSMGTSQDYEVAVEEGATIVRLGSILYA